MKSVLDDLSDKARGYATAPLFAFLRDERIDAARRLAFVPAAAHFVMTFGDLYRFVLPTSAPADRFDELTNAHVVEDSGHWKWYLADLRSMGLDAALPFTDAVRFLWSDVTTRTRRLSYEICALSARRSSVERLTLVLVIEAAGGITLEALAAAGGSLERRLDKRLLYFGAHHLETERHHTVEQAEVRAWLESIELDGPTRASLGVLVDSAFEAFRGFADDCYRLANVDVSALRPFTHDPPAIGERPRE
jgi:hypothetical protein